MEKKVKINGTTWVMKLITTEEIEDLWDGDGQVEALCDKHAKIIYFDADDMTLETVRHELFHAYVADLHLGDTHDIELSNIEEIFAAMFTEKGEKIIRQARRIYKALQKLKEND
jgi:hypothetical protein